MSLYIQKFKILISWIYYGSQIKNRKFKRLLFINFELIVEFDFILIKCKQKENFFNEKFDFKILFGKKKK